MKKILFLVVVVCISIISLAQPNSVFKKADSIFISQNYALAKTEYENIFKTDPGTALAWNRLAFSCYNLGQFDEAIKQFTKSLSLNPSDQLKPFVLIRLAKSYGAKNDKENALSFLQKAVDANYLNWADINGDKNLQLLKGDDRLKKIKESLFAKVNPCMN